MEQSQIEQKVLSFIRDFMDDNKITLTTNLRDEANADSLDFEEIAAELEEQFEIKLNEKDLWEDGSVETGISLISTPKEYVDLIKKSLN